MNKTIVTFLILLAIFTLTISQIDQNQKTNKLVIHADLGENIISKHIYGQFSEHLGRGIYGGIWVGEDSPIPNTRGIRNDVVEALKKIKVPNLRWPGGCFADEYHWLDGIGPRAQRPTMINTHWGGVTEDNSFGTHEFLDLCDQLGAEPYICGNVGSGTVEEMADWVEYLTFDGISPMAELRRENGRNAPWNVKFWGVGNENWGCGGNMTPEYYADLYRRFATYCRNYGDNLLFKIAGGSSADDYYWTEVLMQKVKPGLMNGLSLHYYTVNESWQDKKSATNFDESSYFFVINKCLRLDEFLTKHATIMDKYDPEKKVGLIMDEWGSWLAVEPGTNPGFLYQQNTMRDAFVAAISLNIFHQHCDRVKMANIAQTVNVLQAMILTDREKIILTPTYHVFDMYQVHQDALLLPFDLESEDYILDGKSMKALNVSSSRANDGSIHISIVNVHPSKNMDLECELRGVQVKKVSGKILTAKVLNSHNTFDNPDEVTIADFHKSKLNNNVISLDIPAKSILVLNLR
jgi:alpha-N-arabinofuranosidase